MSILTVKNISHSVGNRTIFENVSFRLLKGEHVGLIGVNGSGKSTFMNIITSKLVPDSGDISWSSKVRVSYLDQQAILNENFTIRESLRTAFSYLFDMENELNELYCKMADETEEYKINEIMDKTAELQDTLENSDFYLIDSKIDEVARGLGLFDIGLEKNVFDLSGGQRTKILLCKLLLEKPDILLLDEPTNYLDEEHIGWLKQYLNNYENAFILISHDIDFLNNVVNLIYNVENGVLARYVGNYDEFLRIYEQEKNQLEKAYVKQQNEISELQDFIARNKARVATTGMAKSRQKKLDKMEKIELLKEKPKPEFNFLIGKTSEKTIFKTEDLVIGYDTPLSRPINYTFERGNKIALIGANGLGKTTLLKSLLGLINTKGGFVTTASNLLIGYFEQEIKEKNDISCIDDIWNEFPSYTQYEVRRALAKCGLTTDQIESKVYVLSGGEQAKVRLCKIINTPTNVLILDEPTNHLDQDAKNELKRALKEYKGAILMVCHEKEFYEDIVTEIWDCKNYSLKI